MQCKRRRKVTSLHTYQYQKSLTEPYCNINDKKFLDKYCDLLLVQKRTEAICNVFFDLRKKYVTFLFVQNLNQLVSNL